MREVCLGDRLRAAAKFVRQDAVFADIGTDHAYLPLFLLAEGKVRMAVCTDVNEGPLNTARINAEDHGITDNIKFILTDGAYGLEEYGITDFAICGMGGELIARIIDDSAFLKKKGTRLILEPMSRQAHLRRFLAEEGFGITEEEYVTDSGKFYLIIVAEYNGEKRKIDPTEAELGCHSRATGDTAAKLGYLNAKRKALIKARDGKLSGKQSAEYENLVLPALDRAIDELNK